MLVAPGLPPNHGTVIVHLGAERYIVDASILHGTPLRVAEHGAGQTEQPRQAGQARQAGPAATAWDARLDFRDGQWLIHWRPLQKPDGLECRIDKFEVPGSTFSELHEGSRGWGPFNYELHARLNHADRVVGTAFGQRIDLDTAGVAQQHPLDHAGRVRFLVEVIGMREELAAQLPSDKPTPPPPSPTAAPPV